MAEKKTEQLIYISDYVCPYTMGKDRDGLQEHIMSVATSLREISRDMSGFLRNRSGTSKYCWNKIQESKRNIIEVVKLINEDGDYIEPLQLELPYTSSAYFFNKVEFEVDPWGVVRT